MVSDDGCNCDKLSASIDLLSQRVDTLIALNRDVVKWLLIVVCVIALGRSAIDLIKDGLDPAPAEAAFGELIK